MASLAVVALAWLAPRPSLPPRWGDVSDRLQGPWQRVQEEWNRLYASLAYRQQRTVSGFARSLTLSGAVSLGSAPVLEIQSPGSRYWRDRP